MAHRTDLERLKHQLIEACTWGDEVQIHALGSMLREHPRQTRALLEALFQDPDIQVRRAASFGLGELGGPASVRLLEQQLAREEAWNDLDGSSVAEAITRALGRIEGMSARASLLRRLERFTMMHPPDAADVNGVARELWRKRHPELLLPVQRSLLRLALPIPNALQGLHTLLEKTPGALRTWAEDTSVALEEKTGVLVLLEEELPDAWVASLSAFLSVVQTFPEVGTSQWHSTLYYCERLCAVLLRHRERVLSSNPENLLATSLALARKLIVSTVPNSSLRAAIWLRFVGEVEDAALLETHRPAEPILAESFDESVAVLRARHQP